MESNVIQTRLRQHLLEVGGTPGSKIPPERELAGMLEVSRPALREAMRRLVHLGLLEQRRGAGTFVVPVQLGDLLEVRQQLEPLAARQAAARRSAGNLEEMASLLRSMRDELDDPEQFAIADMRLHECVAEASGNRILAQILGDLTDIMRLSRQQTAQKVKVRRAALRDLRALVGHISAQEPQAAAGAMQRHLASIGEAIAHHSAEIPPPSRRPA